MPIIYTLSRKALNGLAEVHVRFYNGRTCDLRARTRIYVPVTCWNATEGRCNISRRYESSDNSKARHAQAQLDDLAQRITDAYANAGGLVSKSWLQSTIDHGGDTPALVDIIDYYCDTKAVAPRTRYKFHSLRLHLQRYEHQTHKRLFAADITTQDLTNLVRYFRQSLGQNAIATRMKQVRALVYFVGKPYPNPFERFIMPQEVYADPFFLTSEERDTVAAFDDLTPAKKIQRDIFIFQCHTGCRVSDMYALTPANITDGWLIYTPTKTAREKARTVELPLSQTALAIIERYRYKDMRGRLLPFITDVQYNRAIRDILCAAGITRTIMYREPRTGRICPQRLCDVATSHLARRTFAQIAYARTGNKRLVASMTGHSENSAAFNRYSEVTRTMKADALGRTNTPA